MTLDFGDIQVCSKFHVSVLSGRLVVELQGKSFLTLSTRCHATIMLAAWNRAHVQGM
jgi:hypothetical protein